MEKGQTLIEIIVAIGIIIFALVAGVAATTQSIKTSRVSTSQAEASRYAHEVIAIIQRQKTSDPEAFFTASNCGSFGPYGDSNQYEVEVSCSFNNPMVDQVTVNVVVSWPEDNGSLSLSLDTIMAKASY